MSKIIIPDIQRMSILRQKYLYAVKQYQQQLLYKTTTSLEREK